MIEILNLDTVRMDGVIHGSVTVATLANPKLAEDIQAALVVYFQSLLAANDQAMKAQDEAVKGLKIANDQAAALNTKLEEIKQAHGDEDAAKLELVLSDLKKSDMDRKRDALAAEIAAKQAELEAMDKIEG